MKRTYIRRAIESADEKVQYDEHVKNVLSDKMILAWILKYTVQEVQDFQISEIISCICDDVKIASVPVYPGETNMPERVAGDMTESRISYEGYITYDIRLHLWISRKKTGGRAGAESEEIKLLVNVEAQKAFHQKYDLVTRGIVYVARMISAQLDTEITDSNYQDLKKVYSIWICMNAPDYIGNAMVKYSIAKKDLYGHTPDKTASYDKLGVLMVYLNAARDREGDSIFHLLNVLLSPDMRVNSKEEILQNQFGIKMEREIGEELTEYV